MFLRIRRRRLTFSVTTLLVFVTTIALVLRFIPFLIPGSNGAQIYFSPDTLDTRIQRERLLFGTDVPIWRSNFKYYRKDLVNFLIQKGYWIPHSTDKPRWIMTCHWNHRCRDGHTRLHSALRDAGTPEWVDWCEAHPKLAALVWPRVLELLRSEAPMAESEVFYILWHARHSQSVDKYQDWLKRDSEYQSIHTFNQRHPTKTGGKVGCAHRRIGNFGLVRFATINWRFDTACLG